MKPYWHYNWIPWSTAWRKITHSVCTLAVCSVLWLFVSCVMSLRRAKRIKIVSHELFLLFISYSTPMLCVMPKRKAACLVLVLLFLSDEVSRGQLQLCQSSVHFHYSLKQRTLTAGVYINTVQYYQHSQRYTNKMMLRKPYITI